MLEKLIREFESLPEGASQMEVDAVVIRLGSIVCPIRRTLEELERQSYQWRDSLPQAATATTYREYRRFQYLPLWKVVLLALGIEPVSVLMAGHEPDNCGLDLEQNPYLPTAYKKLREIAVQHIKFGKLEATDDFVVPMDSFGKWASSSPVCFELPDYYVFEVVTPEGITGAERNETKSSVSKIVVNNPEGFPRPLSAKREIMKIQTKERYLAWNKEYKRLKAEKPSRTDSAISVMISKMDIACRKSPRTIRRYMK